MTKSVRSNACEIRTESPDPGPAESSLTSRIWLVLERDAPSVYREILKYSGKGTITDMRLSMDDIYRLPSDVQEAYADHISEDNLLLPVTCGASDGVMCLEEVDSAAVPRGSSEFFLFVNFYEAILRWTLLIEKTVESIQKAKLLKRASRKSHVIEMRALKEKVFGAKCYTNFAKFKQMDHFTCGTRRL
ncbi:hypothetical protein BC832DRAFT_591934 [Gaertneriomyces semiglobifer]|nr:hypothetical protein BC832DRAFT_591934 [Gaertneriomyces semiglobifer]